METLLWVILCLLILGTYHILQKLDFLEKRIDEVKESLTEEIRDNGINQSQDDEV